MNSKTILSDDMTLDEKLAAIDAAMASAVVQSQQGGASGSADAPLDPADLTICFGCQ